MLLSLDNHIDRFHRFRQINYHAIHLNTNLYFVSTKFVFSLYMIYGIANEQNYHFHNNNDLTYI